MPSQYLLAELEAALTPVVVAVKISAALLSAGLLLLFCGVLFGVAAVRITRWVSRRAWRRIPPGPAYQPSSGSRQIADLVVVPYRRGSP